MTTFRVYVTLHTTYHSGIVAVSITSRLSPIAVDQFVFITHTVGIFEFSDVTTISATKA